MPLVKLSENVPARVQFVFPPKRINRFDSLICSSLPDHGYFSVPNYKLFRGPCVVLIVKLFAFDLSWMDKWFSRCKNSGNACCVANLRVHLNESAGVHYHSVFIQSNAIILFNCFVFVQNTFYFKFSTVFGICTHLSILRLWRSIRRFVCEFQTYRSFRKSKILEQIRYIA